MDYKPEIIEELSPEEMERMTNMAAENEDIWLVEYISHLKDGKYWDVDFVDYKCYKVFITEYAKDIHHYRDNFIKNGGSISFEDAGWGMYFIATKQEHRLINETAEA